MANAQDTTTLEGNINTLPQTEAQAAQSLPQLPVISALAPALVSIATQSTPTSTIPTPSLTSKTSPSEPTTPPTPPALRAAGWCCRSQTSSSYQTTPESTVQASLIAALAREDAKDHPAGEEMEAGVTDAQWNAAVFHISVLDNLESRQQERDQLAAFVPVPGYELPSLSAPPPGRQERDFLEDKARVGMLRGRKGKREKIRDSWDGDSMEEELKVAEGWNGGVARSGMMERVFARMVREREEREETHWCDVDETEVW